MAPPQIPPPALNSDAPPKTYATNGGLPNHNGRGVLARALNRAPSFTWESNPNSPPSMAHPLPPLNGTQLPSLAGPPNGHVNNGLPSTTGVETSNGRVAEPIPRQAAQAQAPTLPPLKLTTAGPPPPPMTQSELDRIAARYSPEEWAFRQRQGILSTALRNYYRSKSYTDLNELNEPEKSGGEQRRLPPRQIHTSRSMCIIVDSSDEEHRTGILGRSLSKRRRREARRNGTATAVGSSGSSTFSSGDSGDALGASGLQMVALRDGNFAGTTPSHQRHTNASRRRHTKKSLELELRSDEDEKEATKERTQEEKAEIIELGALADVGDHSDRLLYLAKAGQWDAARSLLLSNLHFNFGLTDKDGLTPLLLAVKNAKTDVVDMMLARGADLYAMTKERMTAVHVCAKWAGESMLRKLIDKKLDVARAAGVAHMALHMLEHETTGNHIRF